MPGRSSPRKRPTIRDVAKAAGVSPAAVTSAMNNGPFVSRTTREHILKVARKLKYRPSHYARKLRTGKSHTVGLAGYFLQGRPYSMALLAEMERALLDFDYQTMTLTGNSAAQINESVLKALREDRLDGVVFCLMGMDPEVLALIQEWNIPVLEIQPFDYKRVHRSVARFLTDDRGGAQAAVRHLIERGCRTLAAAGGPFDDDYIKNRLEGFQAALTQAGLDPADHPVYSFEKEGEEQEFYAATAKKLQEAHTRPDGLFVFSDEHAVPLMSQMSRLGMKIPEDISVVSFDGLPISGQVFPSLTTMKQPVDQIASEAGRMLIRSIDDKSPVPAEDHVFECELISRETVR